MNFPKKRLRFDFMDLLCSSNKNLNPNDYKIMEFLNFKHNFAEKKIILRFPIEGTPYAIRVIRSLEVGEFTKNSNRHFLIFLNSNDVLTKLPFSSLDTIKPLIVDYFYKITNISNIFVEIELYYSNDDGKETLSQTYLKPVFGTIDFDPNKDF